MDNQVLQYGNRVCFRSKVTQKYISLNCENGKLMCNGSHPFFKIETNDNFVQQSEEEFIIKSHQNVDYNGPIIFGSLISLQTKNGLYLICNNNGEIRLDKPKIDDASNFLLKLAKWQIFEANNPGSKRQVMAYDEVVLRSPYGTYIYKDENEQILANLQNVDDVAMWKIQKANTPYVPDWTYLRPYINQNFLLPKFDLISYDRTMNSAIGLKALGEEKKPLGTLPLIVQEYNLIEDLLFVMMSFEGNYIKRKIDPENKNTFIYLIDPDLDQPSGDIALKNLVNKILPLCVNHDKIEVFINIHSQFEYGLVSQALCAAMKSLMREFILLINQLDNEFSKGELNLQKLWFYIQPSFRVMECLVRLTTEAQNIKGGQLLSIIHKLLSSATDPQTHEIFKYLLNKSFLPYMEMLCRWIYNGQIEDTYEEFLILQQKQFTKESIDKDFKDNYWEKRFTLRDNSIPSFLNKHAVMILNTGKYLNVIRECKKQIDCPFSDDLFTNYEGFFGAYIACI